MWHMGWQGNPLTKSELFLLSYRFSHAHQNRTADPIVVKMEVFDPGNPFIIATFFMSLLLSIGLVFGSCGLPQSAVSAPLGEVSLGIGTTFH